MYLLISWEKEYKFQEEVAGELNKLKLVEFNCARNVFKLLEGWVSRVANSELYKWNASPLILDEFFTLSNSKFELYNVLNDCEKDDHDLFICS